MRHVGWEPEGTVSFTDSRHRQEHTAALGTHATKQATLNDITHRTSQPSLLEMDFPLASSSKDPISGTLPLVFLFCFLAFVHRFQSLGQDLLRLAGVSIHPEEVLPSYWWHRACDLGTC